MTLFARAAWPADHRDEIIAGALVGAVVIILGYASGIGVTSAADGQGSGAPPPAAEVTQMPEEDEPSDEPEETEDDPEDDPGDGGLPPAEPADEGAGEHDHAAHEGEEGEEGEEEQAGHDGHDGHEEEDEGQGGHGGHDGHVSPSPSPSPSPTPPDSPSPSPTDPPGDAPCADGEIHLVEPVLVSTVDGVAALLDGLFGAGGGSPADPAEPPRLCTGATP
jgi:hypothetical protein